jgi:hypothetical protein
LDAGKKPEGRRPLGRPRRRWEDNIKMDLREVGWGGMDWISVAQYRDRWRAVVNFLSRLGRFSFSGRTLLHGVSKLLNMNKGIAYRNMLRCTNKDEIRNLGTFKCKWFNITKEM